MSNGDFIALAHELSAFVSNIVFHKNVNRDVELTRDEIDKLKGVLFNSSLPAIFGSTEESTRRVSRFVLMPNSDRKTLPQLILEETEVYPPETGYMCEPITEWHHGQWECWPPSGSGQQRRPRRPDKPAGRPPPEDTASANQAHTFATQAGAVDGAIPLGREDDVEALHIRDEEPDVFMGPQAGFDGEGAWTDEEWQDLRSLLRREKGFMATSATDLPGYTGAIGKFDIPFKDESASHYQKPRRYSPAERSLIDDHFNKLLADGIIGKAPKYCENTCNVVVAMKKTLDGSWTDKRVALDLRGVNELSLRDRTPPRLPEDLFHDVGQDQYMTKLDLRSGFHQIILTDDASLKTCFWWAREGAAPEQYVYKRMPFGNMNSTAMFGRVIEHELRGLSCAKVFCDDILVTSPTARQHLADLEAVMQRLSKVGLRGHPGKSVFAGGGCEFLGFLLRPGKLSPHQAKVAALLELPTPKDVRGVRAVLGFMNFYRIMAVSLQEFEYDIEHGAGSSHTNADVLSRYPRESSLDPTGASLDPTAEEAALPTAGAFACLCARHPRTLEEGTQDVTPIATWQYETHVGRQSDDPCTGHDLASHHLGEHWSMHIDGVDRDPDEDDTLTLWEEACSWVAAYLDSRKAHGAVTRVLSGDCVDGQATSLDTRPLPQRTVSHLHSKGAVVIELCAGLCSGLEAWFIAGGNITKYVYCDNNAKSRQIAKRRLVQLHNRFPQQLPLEALHDTFTSVPQDLRRISRDDLLALTKGGPAEAPRVRVESRHSIAEHATPRVATYHSNRAEEPPVDPPEAVVTQWVAILSAIKRAARLEASELRQLYGPGATASLNPTMTRQCCAG
ncbi:hypothetical protein CYMTET_37618 [Cymbomonas tetramitiformis]|uniref:Reverse transcriptase domain-containing protein n=1 Tax=Cymbomonas tetramitiformis TaxID=36881 RepID=A0AAE0F6H3_9CHLO|nr:hypothetical protein CYMTET_37618 [Cymbomonas tetramitiformis]